MYVLLQNDVVTQCMDYDVVDGGTTTGSTALPSPGLFLTYSDSYSISGNTVTSDEEPMTFSISNDVLTFSSTSVDEYDNDGDGNTTEEYTETITLIAVSSPTPAEMLAAPADPN
jgi:hypothetical protein